MLSILLYILYYFIIKNKQLRYKKIDKTIISILCVKILLRFKNNKNRIKIIIEEVYIVSNLLCDVIVKIKLLKFNRIIIE